MHDYLVLFMFGVHAIQTAALIALKLNSYGTPLTAKNGGSILVRTKKFGEAVCTYVMNGKFKFALFALF